MIHIDHALEATIQFLEAPKEKLTRQVYNLAGLSFTPTEIVNEIQK